MKNTRQINGKWKYALGVILMVLMLTSCDTAQKKSDAYGNFELDKTMISAEAMGQILWLNIDEGMHLKADQIVGQIDTVNLFLQKQQLAANQQLILSNLPDIDAQMKVQEQQKENILVQQRRIKKLFAKKAATQKQLDDVDGSLDLIEAQISATQVKKNNIYEQAKALDAQIAIINHQIEKCTIICPVEGEVLNQYARTGEMAAPAKPMFSIAALEDIRLKVYVSGAQLPHIKLHQEVKVLIDESKDENRSMTGEIVWISSEAEFTPKTVQTKEERVNLVYAVKIKVPNNGELKAGMPGEIMLED
jgi:HlyD family secretion protein